MWEKHASVAPHMCPELELNPQPRYVPYLGIKPETFWVAPTKWATRPGFPSSFTCALDMCRCLHCLDVSHPSLLSSSALLPEASLPCTHFHCLKPQAHPQPFALLLRLEALQLNMTSTETIILLTTSSWYPIKSIMATGTRKLRTHLGLLTTSGALPDYLFLQNTVAIFTLLSIPKHRCASYQFVSRLLELICLTLSRGSPITYRNTPSAQGMLALPKHPVPFHSSTCAPLGMPQPPMPSRLLQEHSKASSNVTVLLQCSLRLG